MTKRSYSNLQFNKYKLQPLDLVVEKSGGGEKTPVGRAVLYEGGFSATYSNFMERIRVNPNVSLPRFFLYWWTANYQARWFVPYFNQTTGIQNLNTFDILNEARIPLPPLDEQRRVVSYLDERCAAIDEDVAKRREVIGKLKEYKKSLIAHAVTKGLDPTAEMKDSGAEWIGKIPKSWEVQYPKALFALRNERMREEDIQLTASQEYGVVPQKEFQEREGRRVVQVILNPEILKHVEPGDFVMHMRSFQGGLEIAERSGCISSAYVMLHARNDKVRLGYFRYLFKSPTYIDALRSTSNLIRDGQALRYANFIQVYLPLPPADVQDAIASYLDERCAVIDEAIARQEQLIDKLGEYRKSIIHHAVTGKIDCTEG